MNMNAETATIITTPDGTRCALIDRDGVVVNAIMADPATFTPAEGLILVPSDVAGPGDAFDGRDFTKPEPPSAPAPETISDRQFFQQLAIAGLITEQEALAAVKTGEIPQALQTLIARLPPDRRFAAEMLLSGATSFERNHAMTKAFADGLGWSEEQIGALWSAAASL